MHAPQSKIETLVADTVVTVSHTDGTSVSLRALSRKNGAGDVIAEWKDGAYETAVAEGTLDPESLEEAAFAAAAKNGLIEDRNEVVATILRTVWPSAVLAFVRATHHGERPTEHEESLEWYWVSAKDIARFAVESGECDGISQRQAKELCSAILSGLYDYAVMSEERPGKIRIDTQWGAIEAEASGPRVTLRSGRGTGLGAFTLSHRSVRGRPATKPQQRFRHSIGRGQYAIGADSSSSYVIFATSDHSDPNANGAVYLRRWVP